MAPTPIIDELLDNEPRIASASVPPSHEQNERDMHTPATMLDVKQAFAFHTDTCPAVRKLHRWGKIACVMLGVVLTLQVLIAGLGRSFLRDTVRAVLREEMGAMAAEVTQPQWSPLVPSAFAKGPTP